MRRRSADSELSRVHAGILSRHLRRGHPKDGECCRKSCEPFALLLSRIRNEIESCKSAKNPYISRAFGTLEVDDFSEIPVNFDWHVSGT